MQIIFTPTQQEPEISTTMFTILGSKKGGPTPILIKLEVGSVPFWAGTVSFFITIGSGPKFASAPIAYESARIT